MRALTRSAVIAAGHNVATVTWRLRDANAADNIGAHHLSLLSTVMPKQLPFNRSSRYVIAERGK